MEKLVDPNSIEPVLDGITCGRFYNTDDIAKKVNELVEVYNITSDTIKVMGEQITIIRQIAEKLTDRVTEHLQFHLTMAQNTKEAFDKFRSNHE